jgi:hypothetical protein
MATNALHARLRRLEEQQRRASQPSRAEQLRVARARRLAMSPAEREQHAREVLQRSLACPVDSPAYELARRRLARLKSAD